MNPTDQQDQNKSLYPHINDYLQKNIYPFHMPGHKRNADFFPKNLIEYDLTEIPGMDNLHYPDGVIKETEVRVSEVYGAERSHILVNGSTCGITAAILSHTGEGRKLLLTKNSHKSAYSGLIMSGAHPVYVLPEIRTGVPVGVTPEAIEAALNEERGISCVLVTSPTYEGMTSDIREIAKVVHRHEGAVLIVDEAHGAHFPFHRAFPDSAVKQGADIVINSLHKTLPLLGQCSVLHVCSERVNKEMLESALRAVQTSSPSYIFMSMIDWIFIELAKSSLFDEYVDMLKQYRAEFRIYKNIHLQDTSDISKLWFTITNGKMSGIDAMSFLRKHGIELEMCGFRHILAMTSVADRREGFERLLKSIGALDEELEKMQCREQTDGAYGRSIEDLMTLTACEKVYSPREMFFMSKRELELNQCSGKVSAQFITPYPPGIPLVVPGERITDRHIELIGEYVKKGMTVEGMGKLLLTVD